jgi:hypothetical protein
MGVEVVTRRFRRRKVADSKVERRCLGNRVQSTWFMGGDQFREYVSRTIKVSYDRGSDLTD